MRATEPKMSALLRSILVSAVLVSLTFGCGGPSSQGGQNPPAASSTEVPELTDEIIHERINDANVGPVPEANGTSEPIHWGFDENEPKEIVVVEKQMEPTRATIVLDIKTTSSARSTNKRYLAGQIRTEWALRTGWVLRRWEIVDTENISMTYKNLPKPPAQNQNESQ